MTELRSQYDWLLFFSIPKILRLYKLLSVCNSEPEVIYRIVREISFLCPNNLSTRDMLYGNILVSVTVYVAINSLIVIQHVPND